MSGTASGRRGTVGRDWIPVGLTCYSFPLNRSHMGSLVNQGGG